MYRLEIKEPHMVNNCNGSYERKASPVFHTWRMRCIAVSEDKQALEEYAEKLPLEMFYFRKREYVIEQAGPGGISGEKGVKENVIQGNQET